MDLKPNLTRNELSWDESSLRKSMKNRQVYSISKYWTNSWKSYKWRWPPDLFRFWRGD